MGVWDTVISVFDDKFHPIIDALGIKDTSLPNNVDVARHALAIQENRKPYLPTLYKRTNAKDDLKQVCIRR